MIDLSPRFSPPHAFLPRLALVGLGLFMLCASVYGEMIPGQMVSWSDFSYVTCIAVSSNYAYLGTTEGILRFDRFHMNWAEPITVSDGMPGGIVYRIAVPIDDDWITVETENGIYTYQFGTDYWYLESDFPVAFEQDSRPTLPLPDMLLPFNFYLTDQGNIADNLFREWPVTALMDDQYQSLLIGTWGLGVLRADNRSLNATRIPCGLIQKRTDAVYIEGDSIWLGGNQGILNDNLQTRPGLTLFDRSTSRFEQFEPRYIPGFDSEIIYDIGGDKNNLYFAGKRGLTIYPRRGQGDYITLSRGDDLPDDQVTALAVGNDSVWVGTTRGVAFYDPSIDTVHVIAPQVFSNLFITDLLLEGKNLFIGTDQGTYYIDTKSKKVGRLKEPESVNLSDTALDPFSILNGEIHDLFVCDSMLFVASDRGLIAVNLATEKIESKAQLIEPVYACAANQKYIAAAVGDGLLLIDRETGRQRRFTEDDGLLSRNINALVPEGDYLWLGSEEGLTRFKWVNSLRVD